jgi:hypothetical protein
MQRRWLSVGLLGVLAIACKGGGGEHAAPQPSGLPDPATIAPAAAASTPTQLPDGCLESPDYLVPPQRYGESDLIRALLVDGDQLFFRNMSDLMRVPLAGGPVVPLGKAPALSLRGTTELFQAGDELVMQSPGEPIFMKAKKSGGAWTSFIDLTAEKRGGGRDAATRLLQGLGKSATPRASVAAFDGKAFYYAEVTQGKGRDAPASSVLKSVAFGGGEPQKLFETPGEISEVTRVGDQVAFHLVLPPTAEQLKEKEAERKKNKLVFGVSGENWLMSVPAAGGAGKRLMRLSSLFGGGLIGTTTILGADGNQLYVTGYAEEDLTKPGIYRIDIASGGSQQLDKRFVRGRAYVAGDRVVIVGNGMMAPPKTDRGILVLTMPRSGTSLTLAHCLSDKASLHATALAGDVVLLSLFEPSTRLSSIAKVPLR